MHKQTLSHLLTEFTHTLQGARIDSPRLSAEVILAHCLNISRNELLKKLILTPELLLTEKQITIAYSLLQRREQGEPIAYLTGYKEFYGRDFLVSKDTLIPRPETELLIDTALEHIKTSPSLNNCSATFVDFGTGSGCIAITMALEAPHLQGIAIDYSKEALAVAKTNAQNLKTQNLTFVQADFNHPPLQAQNLDLILSNPPYVSSDEYAAISHEVREYEPITALVPKNFTAQKNMTVEDNNTRTGLEDLLNLISMATVLLRPQGLFLAEIGHTQGEAMLAATDTHTWSDSRIITDLAGLPRLLLAKKRD